MIVWGDAINGLKVRYKLFVYVPASIYKLGLSSPIIIKLPLCWKSGVDGCIKFQ